MIDIKSITLENNVYHPFLGKGEIRVIAKDYIEVFFIAVGTLRFDQGNNIKDNSNVTAHLFPNPVEIVHSEELERYRRRYNDFHNIQEEEKKDIT